jgi:hypothetical protein
MKKLMSNFSILAASMMVIGHADAEVRVNGFANLTAGISASGDTLYGFTDRISFSEQSLFAIQVSGDINEKMTATGQIVARGSEDFEAGFEWAYITYAATESTNVSAGRLRMPLFQYSASLDVAYSYHWVIAPQAVYNVAFNNIDGVRIDHSGYSGDWEYTFQAALGQINNDFILAEQPGNLNIDNVYVLNGELGYESWKFRGVYGAGKVTFDIPAINPALGQLGQISAELGDTLAAIDDTGTFAGASISYDNFNWFVAGEYTVVEIKDSFFPKETNYYVTAGFRTGKWTPFVTYEKSDLNNDPKFVDQIGAFPAPFQGPLTQLVVGIQQGVVAEDSTLSLGVRYDLDTGVALKADITKNTDDLEDVDNTLMRFAINYVF